jgi:hypothetical protein
MLESVELIVAKSTAKSPVAIIHKVTTLGNFFSMKGNTLEFLQLRQTLILCHTDNI